MPKGTTVMFKQSYPLSLNSSSCAFNPIRTKTPKYLFLRGKDIYFVIKLATQMSLYLLEISKTLLCVDKIKYEHLAILSNLKNCQFAHRIVIFNLCVCCQFEDSQIISPKIIPIEPSQHSTVTNEGSFFSEKISLSFGT